MNAASSIETRENREFASEIKFLVSPELAGQICGWARGRLLADRHGAGLDGDAYQIASLYFDTDRMDVFQRNGSFGRSKYRIRRYGLSEVVFLERKLKTRGLLTKRRSIVKRDELERLAEPEPDRDRGWAGHWFHRRILARQLKPVCQIAYSRTARVAMTQYGPIRLTLDENLRAVPVNRLVFCGSKDQTPLLEHGVILELKFRFAVPTLFKLLVEEFALNPRPISKYRLAVTALGLDPKSAAAECAGVGVPLSGGLTFGSPEGGTPNGHVLTRSSELQEYPHA